MFYERLYEALEILVDFFHADQKGLPLESIKSGETDYCHMCVIILMIFY
jgi:BAI1-associated protein 3